MTTREFICELLATILIVYYNPFFLALVYVDIDKQQWDSNLFLVRSYSLCPYLDLVCSDFLKCFLSGKFERRFACCVCHRLELVARLRRTVVLLWNLIVWGRFYSSKSILQYTNVLLLLFLLFHLRNVLFIASILQFTSGL